MGLSSSQARLLNLTARMHQIEYKAAKLEAQKLQMANESRRVYDEYLDALEQTKVQVKTINNDGSFGYIDATYNNLIAAGYRITITDPQFSSVDKAFLIPITSNESASGAIAINSVSDLQNISSNPSGNYILMTDLDLSGVDWTPIADFSGTLNGNGHVIRNLTVNTSGQAGLFANIVEGSICFLGVVDANVTSTDSRAGILAGEDGGYQGGSFENCYVTGTVYSGDTGYPYSYTGCGSFFGCSDHGIDGTMTNCYADVNLSSAGSPRGGIWGYGCDARIIVTDSYFVDYGNITDHDSEDCGAQSISKSDLNALISVANPDIGYRNSTEWLTNMIKAGAISISKPDSKGNIFETSVAIDTGLQEVADESNLRKAEAKYEADMRKIDAKDRKYDIDLAALDAERNAIKSEMETLKTVAKDNVERTFKLFS